VNAGARPRLLHLVRHGETEGQSSVRFWGSTDVALSDLGRRQVRALAATIAPLRADVIVHSPLSRAVESAALLAEELGLHALPRVVEPAFAEIDFGRIEGLTREEIAAQHPEWFATWQRGQHDGFPGGETLAGFAARVRGGLQRVLAQSHGDVLIVVHRGVIRRIGNAVVGEAAEVPTDLASLSTVQLEPATVVRWNVAAPGPA
jgi:uncharacterized phosphatase